MAIPDIVESCRIAEELERNERKRGGGDFALSFKSVWSAVIPRFPDPSENIYEYIQDDYQGFKERVINGVAVLAAFAMMVSAYSKGGDLVGAAIVSFIIYIFAKGASHIAFAILELAVENWWVVLSVVAAILMKTFG